MGNVSTVQAPTTQAEMDSRRQQLEAMTAGSRPVAPRPSVTPQSKFQVDIAGDGRTSTANLGTQQWTKAMPVRPGNVVIPGVGETTIEAARLAGLLPEGFDKPAGTNNPAAGNPAGKNEPATKDETARGETAEGEDGDIVLPESTQEADRILEDLAGRIGEDAVVGSLRDVAESGIIPDELPAGVSPEQVTSIVEGVTAQADAMLQPSGASVEMLQELLTDDELREARVATIHMDRGRMAHLGKLAVSRLETLPKTDPQAFGEMLDGMPANERRLIQQDEASGEWFLKGTTPLSFGTAVRMGIIKVGRPASR